MKSKRRISYPVIFLLLLLSLCMGSVAAVHAESAEPITRNISLVPGFYCLHPHAETPTAVQPIQMTAVSVDEYTGYSKEIMNQVGAAVFLLGDYKLETDKNVDDGELQAVIWAIVCDHKTEYNPNLNLHLNGRPGAQAYYDYVIQNYQKTIDKYTMTIWTSNVYGYQDILEAKMVEKHSVPSVEKKVWDSNDSMQTGDDVRGWQDSADYDIGDSIPFQITAYLREIEDFSVYYLEFADEMTHLTFDRNSLQVFIDGKPVSEGFEVSWNPDDPNHKKLNIKFNDVKSLGAKDKSLVVVSYKATLDSDAAIGHGHAADDFDHYGHIGNPNEVKLIYSRSTGIADRGVTPTDKVVIFTYEFEVVKVDENHKPLDGAVFELSKFNEKENAYVSLGKIPVTKNEAGKYTAEWKGIDDGKYKLEEVEAPVGYNKMPVAEFTVNALHDSASDDPVLYYLESNYEFANSLPFNYYIHHPEQGEYTWDDDGHYVYKNPDKYNDNSHFVYDGTMEALIENRQGSVLPETGGMGTYPIYLASAVMILASVAMLFRKHPA